VAGDPDARVLVLQEFDLWERAFHRARGFLDGPEAYRSGWSLPLGSAGLMHGLRSASGYARMVHWRAAASWQEYNRDLLPHAARPRRPSAEDGGVTPAFQAQLDRAGVRWVLSPFSLSGGALVPMERDGLLQYRNPGALPRAYIASRWQVAADYGAAEAWLLGEGAETPAIPVIESASAPDPATGGALLPVTVEERGSDRLRLRLPAAAPAGMLVVADTWDAGWQAEVDGVPAPVLVANGYQRAVALPAGAREVTFRYWPEGLSAGLWASLGSLLALAGWAIGGRLAARGERAR
jgi:hypothetical protein